MGGQFCAAKRSLSATTTPARKSKRGADHSDPKPCRLRDGAGASQITARAGGCKECAVLIDEIRVDDRRVIIDVHFPIVVEVAIRPAGTACRKARVDLDVVVD